MNVIYAAKGEAAEFAPLAVNLATTCSIGCEYCYAPLVLRKERAKFHTFAGPRKGILEALERDAQRVVQPGPVLLCFVCDPMQPGLEDVAHKAVAILNRYDVPVILLTKRPGAVDMAVLAGHRKNELWTTITTLDADTARVWELGADTPWARVAMLQLAKSRGLRTAVSLEPVIWPLESLRVIQAAAPYADRFLVGKLNYAHTLHAVARGEMMRRNGYGLVDWPAFRRRVEDMLQGLGKAYTIKRSLQEA